MPDSGASAGPLGDLCNYNQLLKKGAWKGKKIIKNNKKKIKPNLPKPESQSGRALEQNPLGSAQGLISALAAAPSRIRAGSGTCMGTASPEAAAGALEVLPRAGVPGWAGGSCLLHRRTSGWLAGAHPQCLPPSLPLSLLCLFHAEILWKVVL